MVQSFGDGCGLGLGSQISQLVALAVLDDLDHYIKEVLRIKHYIRYMDDFILWDDEKEILRSRLEEIDRFLAERLLLTLKTPALNKTGFGLSFLGYRLFPGHLRLARRSRARLRNRYREARRLFDRDEWNEADFARHIEPLFAFAARAESRRFRRRIIGRGD